MKATRKLVLSLLLIALPLALLAQQPAPKKPGAHIRVEPETLEMGEIEFSKLTQDMGNIKFTVHNDGTTPLILKKVTGCCGTNIKGYPKAPILPGKTGEILVQFRIEPKLQTISRTVTILSNDKEKPEVKHHIKGAVIKDKEKGRLF